MAVLVLAWHRLVEGFASFGDYVVLTDPGRAIVKRYRADIA